MEEQKGSFTWKHFLFILFGIVLIILLFHDFLYTPKVVQPQISPEFVCEHLQAPNSSQFPDLSNHIYNLVVNNTNVSQVGFNGGTATHWIVSKSGNIIGLNCELNMVFCQELNDSNLYCNPLKDEFFEVIPNRWSSWYAGVKW